MRSMQQCPMQDVKITFWTLGLPEGVLSIHPCGPSVCPSLNISETAHLFFLKFCMKLGINKVKNVNWGIKGDEVSKFLVLGIFRKLLIKSFKFFA